MVAQLNKLPGSAPNNPYLPVGRLLSSDLLAIPQLVAWISPEAAYVDPDDGPVATATNRVAGHADWTQTTAAYRPAIVTDDISGSPVFSYAPVTTPSAYSQALNWLGALTLTASGPPATTGKFSLVTAFKAAAGGAGTLRSLWRTTTASRISLYVDTDNLPKFTVGETSPGRVQMVGSALLADWNLAIVSYNDATHTGRMKINAGLPVSQTVAAATFSHGDLVYGASKATIPAAGWYGQLSHGLVFDQLDLLDPANVDQLDTVLAFYDALDLFPFALS